MSRAGTSLSIMAVVALIAVMAQHTRADVLLEEPFSTDVVGSGNWTASDVSVSVDVANGWLRIGSDGAQNDFAEMYSSFPLPLVIEWRERTFSGDGAYISLPKLEFWWGPSSGDSYHITYVQDDQSGSPDDDGWLFGSWTNVHTLGPTDWSQWRTVKAIIRSDGGELFAKPDGDPDFTPLATLSWAIPNVIERIRLSQHSDDVSEFDYIRITSPSAPFCDGFESPDALSEWSIIDGDAQIVSTPTHCGCSALELHTESGDCEAIIGSNRTIAPLGEYSVWVRQDNASPWGGGTGFYFQLQSTANPDTHFWRCYRFGSDAGSYESLLQLVKNPGDGTGQTLGALRPVQYTIGDWVRIFVRQTSPGVFEFGYELNGNTITTQCVDPNPITEPGMFALTSCSAINESRNYFDDVCFDSSFVCSGSADGAVPGSVVTDCLGQQYGLLGVRLDAFDETGHLVSTGVTDESGAYIIDALLVGEPYTITLVTPLGYTADPDELLVEIGCEGSVTANFVLSCAETTGEPRTIGFWKHQVGVATGGKGTAQIDAASLCGSLDLIEGHFNNNVINQVAVYNPPASLLCDDKIVVAKELLNLKGNVGMTARARQQLMALLLNVAAGYVSLTSVVSDDGATLSQAITYSDQLIDNPAGDHEMAKTICDLINNNQIVASGVIPLGTANIAYKTTGTHPGDYGLGQNYPNPFNAGTVISFTLAEESQVRLDVFDVLGRRVATLTDDLMPAGEHHVSWDAADVASGVYFARLVTSGGMMTRKMVLVR